MVIRRERQFGRRYWYLSLYVTITETRNCYYHTLILSYQFPYLYRNFSAIFYRIYYYTFFGANCKKNNKDDFYNVWKSLYSEVLTWLLLFWSNTSYCKITPNNCLCHRWYQNISSLLFNIKWTDIQREN